MNNITTIKGHVLLPHQADWTNTPNVSRLWRSPVENAVSGKEDRTSVRDNAWFKMTYSVFPHNHVERARFDDRMRAALKAGKLAVPHWGRGVPLEAAATASDTTLTLARADHDIVEGEHVLVQPSASAEFDTWDLAVVVSVAGAVLTLGQGIGNAYAAGVRVWPLLFGKPMMKDFKIKNLSRADYDVTIQFDQRPTSPESVEDWSDYAVGPVTSAMNGGRGWDGAWETGVMA